MRKSIFSTGRFDEEKPPIKRSPVSRVIEDSDRERLASWQQLKENVITTLLFELNTELSDFRHLQSVYVKKLDSRKKTVDLFSLASDAQNPYEVSFLSQDAQQQPEDAELTIDQIQAIIENEHMVKEREQEVIKISKSILELNMLFKVSVLWLCLHCFHL